MWSFIFIFSFVVLFMIILTSLANNGRRLNPKMSEVLIILALITFVFFIGTRFNVGRDFASYWKDYYAFSNKDYGLGTRFQLEYANYGILYICHAFDWSPQSYFVITLKSATKLFSVLLASKRPLITELADKLRLKYPLLPSISPCPTMRLEAIRSIIPISCRRYPKSV